MLLFLILALMLYAWPPRILFSQTPKRSKLLISEIICNRCPAELSIGINIFHLFEA